MKAEALQAHSKLLEIESRLSKFAYLSKQALPGAADALIFQKLKSTQKIPTKQRYFYFYHWYCTMSQFAEKQMDNWIKGKQILQEDKLIGQCSALIESLKTKQTKPKETSIDYEMRILLKQPAEENIAIVKNKLLALTPEHIGEQLKIIFKNQQENGNEHSQNANQLRILFKLKSSTCEKLKDIISKWPQYQNIQTKKQMKQKRT